MQDTAKFFEEAWEKKAAYLPCTEARAALLPAFLTWEALLSLASRRDEATNSMIYGTDVVAARYQNSTRSTIDAGSRATSQSLKQRWKEGWTLQVHQPQRFDDALWRLCAALEAQLGCLVGCNHVSQVRRCGFLSFVSHAHLTCVHRSMLHYITPNGKQGLAPHFDDVEIFVLQTEGAKRWKVYDTDTLAAHPSGDLDERSLETPSLEVTLQPGDCLYMPRGTIHMAVANRDQLSAHLTISTYQRWTRLDLVHHLIGILLNQPVFQLNSPIDGKRSLPLGVPFQTGAALAGVASGMSATLRALASDVDQLPIPEALDSMAADFMRSRLPPYPTQLRSQGPLPTNKNDLIQPRLRRCCRLFPGPSQDDSLRAFSESGRHGVEHQREVTSYILVTCLENPREQHMLLRNDEVEGSESEEQSDADDVDSEDIEDEESGDDDNNFMAFPPACCAALEKALQLETDDEKAVLEPVRIDDLPLAGSSEVRIQLAQALWRLGVVSITSSQKSFGKTTRKAPGKNEYMRPKKSRRKG